MLFSLCIYGQFNYDYCYAPVEQAIETLNALEKPLPGKMHFIDLVIKNSVKTDAGGQMKTSYQRIFLTQNLFILESDITSVYGDTNETYMVYHPNRVIVKSIGSGYYNFEEVKTKTFEIQKTLIKESRLVNCSYINENGLQLLETSYILNDSLSKTLGINSMRLQVDTSRALVYRVEKFYNDESKVQNQVVTYNKIRYNIHSSKRGKASSYIFKKDEILLDKYSSYHLYEK